MLNIINQLRQCINLKISSAIAVTFLYCSLPFANASNTLAVYTEMNPETQQQDPLYKNGYELLLHSHINYELSSVPWVRAYSLAVKRENSLLFPMYRMPEREDKFHWICPIAPSRDLFLFKLSNRKDLHVSQLSDARRNTIGVVKNSMVERYLVNQGFSSNSQLDQTAYDSTNLTKLLKGRLDYIAHSSENIISALDKLKLPHDIVTREFLIFSHKKYPLCAGVNINSNPIFIRKLKHSYQQLFGQEGFEPKVITSPLPSCKLHLTK